MFGGERTHGAAQGDDYKYALISPLVLDSSHHHQAAEQAARASQQHRHFHTSSSFTKASFIVASPHPQPAVLARSSQDAYVLFASHLGLGGHRHGCRTRWPCPARRGLHHRGKSFAPFSTSFTRRRRQLTMGDADDMGYRMAAKVFARAPARPATASLLRAFAPAARTTR